MSRSQAEPSLTNRKRRWTKCLVDKLDMDYLIAAIAIGTVGYALLQGWMIRKLRYRYSQPTMPWPENRPWPKTAIILSLRGSDPFLESCLRNLLDQDYPDFRLHVIVDSDTDPAWDVVHAVQNSYGQDRFSASVLRERSLCCSLKNSSIIQAINNLSPAYEVVAFVDADAITHRTWLRELVSPLADHDVGCSTGIRWFAPARLTLGARIRCYWNQVAAAILHQANIPWGGSMVVRRNILDSGLTDEWSRMFCEDVHTLWHLRRRGLKLAYVPEVTVINEETTSLAACLTFVNRQTLIFRLYHERWWAFLAIMIFAASLRVFHIGTMVHTLVQADFVSLSVLLGVYPIILLIQKREAWLLDISVARMLAKRGCIVHRNPIPGFVSQLVTEMITWVAMFSSLTTHRVIWRGIHYDINGPKDITMRAYESFSNQRSPATNTATVL